MSASQDKETIMAQSQMLRDGIYPPLPTFFDQQDELDLVTLRRHMQRLAETGIAGYVIMGTNGEAVHLTKEERTQVVETARATAGEHPLILAGSGQQSTPPTIAHFHP